MPFRLEVEVAARVAAVGTGEALVGHHHGGVDLEMLEAVRADEVTRRAEAAAGLGAANVATDVVEPFVAHAEDRAVLLRGHLAIRDAVGAAGGRQQVLAPVLDPLDGDAGVLGGQGHQRDVRVDARLDPERAADVGRHDEAQAVLRQPQHPRRERVHDERSHEVRPHRAHAVELPARDDPVGLDGRGAVLRELEPLAQHDVGLARTPDRDRHTRAGGGRRGSCPPSRAARARPARAPSPESTTAGSGSYSTSTISAASSAR